MCMCSATVAGKAVTTAMTNTESMHQSRFYNRKLVQTLLEGHSILSLEDSLSWDCVVEKNDVGMLDGFDRGLQTNVQVFVDFDYAMGRSITVMRCMTFTEAWKKVIWLKGLLTESGYELRLLAGIATGALVKGSSRSEVPAQGGGFGVVINSGVMGKSTDLEPLYLTVGSIRTTLIVFPAQSVRSSNAYALYSLYLLLLNTGTSQSRQHDMSKLDSYYLSD
ncbi:hypothetical protein Tco_0519745 [Tanacetum coccineum]